MLATPSPRDTPYAMVAVRRRQRTPAGTARSQFGNLVPSYVHNCHQEPVAESAWLASGRSSSAFRSRTGLATTTAVKFFHQVSLPAYRQYGKKGSPVRSKNRLDHVTPANARRDAWAFLGHFVAAMRHIDNYTVSQSDCIPIREMVNLCPRSLAGVAGASRSRR